MNVMDRGVKRIMIVEKLIFGKSIQVLRREKLRRFPVCITMDKGIIKVLNILTKVVEAENQGLVTYQFKNRVGKFPSLTVNTDGFYLIGKYVAGIFQIGFI